MYYLRAAGNMGGGMIVVAVVKCRGEETGNMQLRQTRRSTHNNCGALVNVTRHDDVHYCCLGEGKARFTLDCPIECCAFKSLSHIALAKRNAQSIPQSCGVPVGTKYGESHSAH